VNNENAFLFLRQTGNGTLDWDAGFARMELPDRYFKVRAPLISTFGPSFQRAYTPVTEPLTPDMEALLARLDRPSSQCRLRSMSEFDPAKPAILHDVLNDRIVTWDLGDADDFRRSAIFTDDGLVAWRGQVFDGWEHVLGGTVKHLVSMKLWRMRKH
jgi:hypothetical protein